MEKLSFILSKEQWSPAIPIFLRSAFWRWCGTKMAPVPDLVLMCLAVSYSKFRSSEWWQIMSGGAEGRSHAHRHGWRVLWKHREQRIKTHRALLGQTPQLVLHTATASGDVNMLWLWFHCVVNSALPLASSKHFFQSSVSWGERARRRTYVLALKGVEEVSTQLPVIPWGPRRIANAT